MTVFIMIVILNIAENKGKKIVKTKEGPGKELEA